MKTLRAFLVVALSVVGVGFGVQASGCAWTDGGGYLDIDCPPDAGPEWDEWCKGDGGVTGGQGGSGGAGGSGGQGGMAFCPGSCIPKAPKGWMSPEAYWVGDGKLVPTDCEAVGGEPLVRYGDPFTEAMDCGSCVCDPSQGECSPIPEAITVYSKPQCDPTGEATDFSGPPGWDGTCTTANALPKNADCNGVLCSGSVYVGTLPPPVEGSCQANAIGVQAPPPIQWDTGALRCREPPMAAEISAACGDPNLLCDRVLPAPYRYCIARTGDVACPANTVYSKRFLIALPNDVIDTRACSACDCVTKDAGACAAQFLFAENNTCDLNSNYFTIASSMSQCLNLMVPGQAVGSKSVTDLQYLPGTCDVTGGEAMGSVQINPDRAATICCREEIY